MEKVLKVAILLSAVDKMSRVVESASQSSIKSLTRVQKETGKLADGAFKFGRQAGAFGLAIAAPLGLAVKAAEESEVANARLENVFRSMGDATGEAAKAAEAYASSLQMQIGVEDEIIMLAQAKLATFQDVSSETARMAGIFDRATNAAFDMAAAGFGEGEQNAVQLGKALQDPIKGINSLARSGVTFTNQEKDKIKKLVESGKLLKAQEIILKAVEKQVGGTGKATATTSAKTKAAFGEVAESVGKILLPQINKLLNKLIPVLENVIQWIEKNPKLAEGIAMGAAAVAGLALASSALSFVFGGMMKIIQFGSMVFKGLSMAIGWVSTAIRVMTAAMMANPILAIIMLILGLVVAIIMNWDKLVVFFKNLWEKIKNIFKAFWNWLKDHVPGLKLIVDNWDKIVAYFRDLWERVKAPFIQFWKWIKGIGSAMYEGGKNIVTSIWDGMKAAWGGLVDWFKSGLKTLREYLPFSPAKRGPLMDIHRVKLVETIASNIKPGPLVSAMNRATGSLRSSISKGTGLDGAGGGSRVAAGSGGSITINFSPTINAGAGGGGSKQDFIQSLREYQPELLRLLEDAMARRDRKKFA